MSLIQEPRKAEEMGMNKKKRSTKTKDVPIKLRVWLNENGVKKQDEFLIDRSAKTVDIDLWVSSKMEYSTEVQCNYPAIRSESSS
jgi:hypothetical protein